MKTDLLFGSFPFIAGSRVTLSRMTEMDLKALWDVMGDEENYRFLPTAAAADLGECVRRFRRAEELFKERRAVMLGVYPTEAEYRLIGTLTVGDIDERVGACTLSFVLGRAYTGRGYAACAVQAAADYLLGSIGFNRIAAYVLPVNDPAARTLERCGFQREGTLREAFFWPDKGVVDLTVYSLLKSDRKTGREKHFYF